MLQTMAILQSFCCWRSLRKGSYASAAYTMAYFSVTTGIVASFLHEERRYWSGNMSAPQSASFLEPETISPTTMTFNVVVCGCASVGVVASLLLIYGIYKDNRTLLVPWILTVITTTLVDLAHSLYLFALETMKFNPMTAILFTLDFFLLSLNVYCLLCVVSQYQEYKAGRGTAGHDEINRRVPPVRYAVQPTATSCLSTRRAVTYNETRATPTQSPTVIHTSILPEPISAKPAPRKHVQFGDDAQDLLHANWKQSGDHKEPVARDAPDTEAWTNAKSLETTPVDIRPFVHSNASTPNGQIFDK